MITLKNGLDPYRHLVTEAFLKSQMSMKNLKEKRMKKIMMTAALFLLGITAFCQEETNGTIYIKHPYIDVVNKAVKAYTAGDFTAIKMNFADSATFWQDGMEKFAPVANLFDGWKKDLDFFSDISMTPVGYPDYLHYKKDDSKIVQSWWTWSGKSKKSGEVSKVPVVMYDEFNSAGKVVKQYTIGDFSKAYKERM